MKGWGLSLWQLVRYTIVLAIIVYIGYSAVIILTVEVLGW